MTSSHDSNDKDTTEDLVFYDDMSEEELETRLQASLIEEESEQHMGISSHGAATAPNKDVPGADSINKDTFDDDIIDLTELFDELDMNENPDSPAKIHTTEASNDEPSLEASHDTLQETPTGKAQPDTNEIAPQDDHTDFDDFELDDSSLSDYVLDDLSLDDLENFDDFENLELEEVEALKETDNVAEATHLAQAPIPDTHQNSTQDTSQVALQDKMPETVKDAVVSAPDINSFHDNINNTNINNTTDSSGEIEGSESLVGSEAVQPDSLEDTDADKKTETEKTENHSELENPSENTPPPQPSTTSSEKLISANFVKTITKGAHHTYSFQLNGSAEPKAQTNTTTSAASAETMQHSPLDTHDALDISTSASNLKNSAQIDQSNLPVRPAPVQKLPLTQSSALKQTVSLIELEMQQLQALCHQMMPQFDQLSNLSANLIKHLRQLQRDSSDDFSISYEQIHDLRKQIVAARQQATLLPSLLDIADEALESELYIAETRPDKD